MTRLQRHAWRPFDPGERGGLMGTYSSSRSWSFRQFDMSGVPCSMSHHELDRITRRTTAKINLHHEIHRRLLEAAKDHPELVRLIAQNSLALAHLIAEADLQS